MTGSITLYNDCSRALKALNSSSRKFKRFLQDDYDIISETRNLIEDIKKRITFSLVWVKGHYSGKKDTQHLMNDHAHDLAVAALKVSSQQLSECPPPSELVTLHSQISLTSRWQAILQEQAHAEPLRLTICKNNCWTDDQFDMVDWAALHTCLTKYPRGRLLTWCKLLHNLLNTNEQNNKYYKSSAQCPHCLEASETFWHVLSCSHPEVAHFRSNQQDILWATLTRLQTPDRVVRYLKMGVSSTEPLTEASAQSCSRSPLTDNEDTATYSQSDDTGLSAFYQQSQRIGLDNLLRGRI
jgi:glutaredoxin